MALDSFRNLKTHLLVIRPTIRDTVFMYLYNEISMYGKEISLVIDILYHLYTRHIRFSKLQKFIPVYYPASSRSKLLFVQSRVDDER